MGKKGPFVPNYVDKLTHFDKQRYLEKIKLCEVDPFDLVEEDLSDDFKKYPRITPVDRYDFFVYRTSFASKDAMKTFKSLEAHNFFTSGHVYRPKVKPVTLNDTKAVIVLAKVKHSQSHSLPPLRLWLLVKEEGDILTCHCTCMAGRGETCSHVAAVVFYIEYVVQTEESLTCTDKVNAWLPPTLTRVPYLPIKDIDFQSAKSRFKNLKRSPEGNEGGVIKRKHIPAAQNSSAEEKLTFLEAVAKANPTAAVLSTYPQYCEPFIPKERPDHMPKYLYELYDESLLDMSYEDLLLKCETLLQELCVTSAQVQLVEEKTKEQSKSSLWFKYRKGRITASNVKKVLSGNILKPALSTVTCICYGGKEFYSEECERGKKLEPHARKVYTELQGKIHKEFDVKCCGLFLSEKYPFLAASPDGIVHCNCCPGLGCLEIKCPRGENLMKCFEGDELQKSYAYYFQVQTRMLICNAQYCDFYVFTMKEGSKLVRIFPDVPFQNKIVNECEHYFRHVILPELVAKWFSRKRLPLAPLNLDTNGNTTVVCFCQSPRRDPMVTCAGKDCTFVEFHLRCVNLRAAPKQQWFCDQCN